MSSEITEVCTVQLNFAQDGALLCKFITLPKQYICIYIYIVCDLHPCQILVNKLISNAAYNHNKTSKLQSLMKI
jgi:hypothetical protein